jgi:hypothetical protein
MSQDTLVTKANAVVFAFAKGGSSWDPIAGANDVSHVCIYKNSSDNYRLVVSLEKNNKVLVTENMNKDHKYTTDPAQPKFHKYKIEMPNITKYYGFNFVEDHEGKSFEREVRLALLKAKPVDGGKPNGTKALPDPKSKTTNSHSPEVSKVGLAKSTDHINNHAIETKSTTPPSKPRTTSVYIPSGSLHFNAPSNNAGPVSPKAQGPSSLKGTSTSPQSSPRGAVSSPNTPPSTVKTTFNQATKTPPSTVHTPALSKIASTAHITSPSSINSAASTTSPVTSPKGDTRDRREKIIDEILSTEKDYIDSLRLLNELYFIPLKYASRLKSEVVIPKEDLNKIFYGFYTIFELNKTFEQELQALKHNNTLYLKLGQVFRLFAPSMKLYIDYVNKYEGAIQTIDKYKAQNSYFVNFLRETNEDPESQRRGIGDFLIMPIQRIPRYVLLLNELLKKTDGSHQDYLNIKSALDEVEKIANYINERKKEHDSLEMVQKIQDRFSPKDAPLLKESRRFIYEISLYTVDPEFQPPKNGIKKKKGKEPTPDQLGLLKVEFFLFNDIGVWGVQDKQYLVQRNRVKLLDLMPTETTPYYTVPFYEITDNYKGFTLMSSQGPVETFYATEIDKIDQFLKLLSDAITKENDSKLEELKRKQTKKVL